MSFDKPGAPTEASPTSENETELTPAAEVEEGLTAADSSPVDEPDANEPTDLLSVVKDAVAKVETPADSSTAEEEGEAEAKAAAEGKSEADTPEAQAESDAKLPFHEHPRWKEVIGENRELRPLADQQRQIQSYMAENGLTAEEVAEGFTIMSALKSRDPKLLGEAREYFAKSLSALDGLLGQGTLPADLQEKVDTGLIDEETALEVAQSRATAKLSESQVTERQERDSQAQVESDARALAQTMGAAVEKWETGIKASDPDYPKKAALVETTARAIVQRTGKPPRNAEEAVKLAEDALKEVNQHFKGLTPTKRPIRPAPSGSSKPTVAEPKTLLDAVRGALAS